MSGRIRSLKPEINEDERVAKLSHGAYRLFVGAIAMADDFGNYRASASHIRGQIYWGREDTLEDVERYRDELFASGLHVGYQVRGQSYAHIAGWGKHQRVDNAGKARMPGQHDPDAVGWGVRGIPPRDSASLGETPLGPRNLAAGPGGDPQGSPPDLRSPITDPDTDQYRPTPRFAAGAPSSGSSDKPREQEYQRAYERGVAKGKGSPYAMPDAQRGPLHQGLSTFARDEAGAPYRGEKLLRWIEHEAAGFGSWLVRQDEKTIDMHSAYGPKGWLRWLNKTPVDAGATPARAGPESAALRRLGAGIGQIEKGRASG